MADIWKHPMIIKAAIVSAVVTVLELLGFAVLTLGNFGFTPAILGATLLVNFVVLAILCAVYDLAKGRKIYWADAIWGGVIGAIVLTGFAGIFGLTSFGANFVVAFVIVGASLFVGFWAGKEIKI